MAGLWPGNLSCNTLSTNPRTASQTQACSSVLMTWASLREGARGGLGRSHREDGLVREGWQRPCALGEMEVQGLARLLRGGDGRGLEAGFGVPAAHRKEPVGGK